jgi:hypothetical protein
MLTKRICVPKGQNASITVSIPADRASTEWRGLVMAARTCDGGNSAARDLQNP